MVYILKVFCPYCTVPVSMESPQDGNYKVMCPNCDKVFGMLRFSVTRTYKPEMIAIKPEGSE